MKQTIDGSGNVQFGTVRDSTVNVNTYTSDKYVQLTEDNSKTLKLSLPKVKYSAYVGASKFILTVIVGNALVLLNVSNLTKILPILPPLLVLVVIGAAIIWAQGHFDDFRRNRNRPRNGNSFAFAGNNEILREDRATNSITVATFSGACVYPKCDGDIYLMWAPDREKLAKGSKFVGICSKCGKAHSYRVDNNFIATPAPDMDWSPVKQEQSK
jgi:hypothetical protein